MKQKIEFYDSIGLHSIAVIEPRFLMQSTKLSYARYMFFKERGIDIDETNFRKLFQGQKQFEKQYGLTKEELLERYPYVDTQDPEETPKKGSENTEKQELVEKILEQQKTIAGQNEEINKLKGKQNEEIN